MSRFTFYKQQDAMQCGIASLAMICHYHGVKYSLSELNKRCGSTIEGVSVQSISSTASNIGLESFAGLMDLNSLRKTVLPCILHWNQNHFVVLYKTSNKFFFVADPAKGLIKYPINEFKKHWCGTVTNCMEKGVVILFRPTSRFYSNHIDSTKNTPPRSFKFLFRYITSYKQYFIQIVAGLAIGCVLQMIMPFLTQAIVDLGIRHEDIGLIWLILLGELMIVIGRTATDFIRRWLLLHISMRINISLVSDFFIKLLKLPMSFFDTKLMGDLLQRIGDHTRVQNFLTGQVLNIIFTFLSFIIFGIVLFVYNPLVFGVFAIGSVSYGFWITSFLRKRKVLDYDLFEKQATNQNNTYQFINSMQEIKLQDCEQRRRWEWEDTQADLFYVQMKSLKLQQTQEAGSIFITMIR